MRIEMKEGYFYLVGEHGHDVCWVRVGQQSPLKVLREIASTLNTLADTIEQIRDAASKSGQAPGE